MSRGSKKPQAKAEEARLEVAARIMSLLGGCLCGDALEFTHGPRAGNVTVHHLDSCAMLTGPEIEHVRIYDRDGEVVAVTTAEAPPAQP